MAMSVTYATVHGRLVEENRGGVVTEYVPDTLGNVIMTTDESGTVTSTTTYWPFGEVRSQTGTNPSPWGFCGVWGYLTDAVSRMYVRARHYRADTSRWLTVDPLWPLELPYGYSSDQPTTQADPTGLAACNAPDDNPCAISGPLGGCIAMLCSLKSGADIVNYIRTIGKFIGEQTLKHLIGLINDSRTKLTAPTPADCCRDAHSYRGSGPISKLGQLVKLLCQQSSGTVSFAQCSKRTDTEEDCKNCCAQMFPYPSYDDPSFEVRETLHTRCETLCATKSSHLRYF